MIINKPDSSSTKLCQLTQQQEIDLIQCSKTDENAMEQLILLSKDLIGIISKKFHKSNIDLRDLYQQGVLGIMKAVETFDPKIKARFSTYSRWWIMAKMQEFYLANTRAFSIPVSVSQSLNTIQNSRAFLEKDGYAASSKDVANHSNITHDKYDKLMSYVYYPETIPLCDFESEQPSQQFPDNERDTPAEHCARQDSINRVRYALSKLSERERKILIMRHGINGGEPKTLQETGRSIGLSYEGVRKMQQIAEEKVHSIILH